VSLVELFRGHERGERFEVSGGGFVSIHNGAGIPRVGRDIIERQASAGFKEHGESGFGQGIALTCREVFPASGFLVAGLNTHSFGIKDSEIVLSDGVAKISGGMEPTSGFVEVAVNARAVEIHGGEVALGVGIVLLSGSEIKLKSAAKIFGNAEAVLVEKGKIVLRDVIVVKSGSLIVFGGLGVVAGKSAAVFVEIAEDEFSARVVMRSEGAKPGEGGAEVG
jgi:hypothetical protein